MKVGDKYIIEIEEVIRRNGAPQIARIKGFNALVFDKCGLEKLEPYDENNWKSAYLAGYKLGNADRSCIDPEEAENKAYNRGLNDAWNAARKIGKVNWLTLKEMGFENKDKEKNPSWDVVMEYSAFEAIAKIKAYEEQQKQDDKIKVGDEVVYGDAHVVITYISPEGERLGFLLNKTEYGEQGQGYTCMSDFNGWRKTGRHFPQIAEVLKKLRGEE